MLQETTTYVSGITIEELPDNVHFLQDKGCEVFGIKFFGLGYNHPEELIPNHVDVLVTHDPPMMILDESNGKHWGNKPLGDRVMEVKPKYHLFGHAHESHGTEKRGDIIFSNGASLNDLYEMCHKPKLFRY